MAIFSIFFLALSLLTLSPKPTSSFSFPKFQKNPTFDAQIALFGDAAIVDVDSSIRITRPSIPSSGRIIYKKPISFLDRNPRKIASFSTYFSFSISPGGDGIAFVVLPAEFPFELLDRHRLMGSDRILAVELDASPAAEFDSLNRTCGGIVRVRDVSVLNLVLNSGEKLHSWIDYDSGLKKLEVRLSKSGLIRPSDPLVSYPVDLSGMWKDEMFVGISSSSGNSTMTSSVYSWSFRLKSNRYSMHSEPLDPRAFLEQSKRQSVRQRSDTIWRILAALVFGAGCGVGVAALVLFVWLVFVDRQSCAPKEFPVHPVDFEYEKIITIAIKDTDSGTK